LLAYFFGASRTVDVYYAAFKIPDLVLVVGGSIVSIAVLVPFLTRELDDGKEQAKRFIDAVFTAFFHWYYCSQQSLIYSYAVAGTEGVSRYQ